MKNAPKTCKRAAVEKMQNESFILKLSGVCIYMKNIVVGHKCNKRNSEKSDFHFNPRLILVCPNIDCILFTIQ